jgi:hypothetical protein
MGKRAVPGRGMPEGLTAAEFNNAMDAGRWWAEFIKNGTPTPQQTISIDYNFITVKNISGAQIVAGEVLEIGDKRLTTLERTHLWFAGDTPEVPSIKLWGVAPKAIVSNGIGQLQVSGVCVASVTINDAQHEFADVADGEITLSSGWHGARILYKPTGTGVLTCALRLDELHDGPIKAVVYETGGIDAGDTGTVTIWRSGAETTTPDRVEAKYGWMASGNAAEGAKCLIRWVRDEGFWEIFQIEC